MLPFKSPPLLEEETSYLFPEVPDFSLISLLVDFMACTSDFLPISFSTIFSSDTTSFETTFFFISNNFSESTGWNKYFFLTPKHKFPSLGTYGLSFTNIPTPFPNLSNSLITLGLGLSSLKMVFTISK